MNITVADSRANSTPRVLIVDRSSESREVLKTILELRGAATLEAERPEHACLLTKQFRPHLIVFDVDCDITESNEASDDLRATAGHTDTPIVILGTLRGSEIPEPAERIAKPYHYGTLIRRIDDILAAA